MRMLFAWLAVAAIVAPAVAEEPKVQKFQRTKYQLLEQSMEALLDGGYSIVNMSAAARGSCPATTTPAARNGSSAR
jgi:hypothetical protein